MLACVTLKMIALAAFPDILIDSEDLHVGQHTFCWRVPLPVAVVLYIKGYTVGIDTVLTLRGRLNRPRSRMQTQLGESFHSARLCLLSAPSASSCGKAAAAPPGQVVALARFFLPSGFVIASLSFCFFFFYHICAVGLASWNCGAGSGRPAQFGSSTCGSNSAPNQIIWACYCSFETFDLVQALSD